MRLFVAALVAMAGAASLVNGAPGSSHAHLISRKTSKDATMAGYLFVGFQEKSENVSFWLSEGNDPSKYQPLKLAQPLLTAAPAPSLRASSHVTVGTGGVRDPFLVRAAQPGGRNYILATNANLKAINYDFDKVNRHGTTGLLVWTSEPGSLSQWNPNPRLINIVPRNFGFVAAPEAIWDPSQQKYLLTWSSAYYGTSDPDHQGQATPTKIFYAYTDNFIDLYNDQPPFPKVYLELPVSQKGSLRDLTLRYVGQKPDGEGHCYVRFFRDDSDNVLKVRGQISNDGIFGHFKDIGQGPTDWFPENSVANGGPLFFQDNLDRSKWHVWVDLFTTGYKPFETGPSAISSTNGPLYKPGTIEGDFPKDLKQGSVEPVTMQEYQDLLKTLGGDILSA